MPEKTLRNSVAIALILSFGLTIGLALGRIFTSQSSENQFVVAAEYSHADLSQRVASFPATYISRIDIELSSPNHWVRLEWSGPQATQQNKGPFRSSPGKGTGWNCNELRESQRSNSCCTPKGMRHVQGFNEYLPSRPECKFVTWFHLSREIAIHSSDNIPPYPSSFGCVRVSEETAQLIHNNALIGTTEIHVHGTWTSPPDLKRIDRTLSAAR